MANPQMSCPTCGGEGWKEIFTPERRVTRCECRIQARQQTRSQRTQNPAECNQSDLWTSSTGTALAWPQLVASSAPLVRTAADQHNGPKVAFIARFMAQFGLPHRSVPGDVWERVNGNLKLRVVNTGGYGIASGSMPRVLMLYVSTWQVQHSTAEVVELGRNLSSFLRDDLRLHVTGGPRGYIKNLKIQLLKLFGASFSISVVDPSRGGVAFAQCSIASEIQLWESLKQPEQEGFFPSYVRLSKEFRENLIEHPIPIDWRAIPQLMASPLALDLYFWLSSRFYTLRRITLVPWAELALQFGSQYASGRQGLFSFRRQAEKQLRERVLTAYPQARVEISSEGVRLHPSPTPIRPTKRFSFPIS